MSSVFKGILSSIKTTLDDLNNANFFGDIGESLANMLVGAFSKDGLFDRVSRTIGSALTSSLQLLTGFTTSMNKVDYSTGLNGWQTFGQGLANSFNNIFTDDNVSSIVGNLDGMANGIVQSLETSLGSEEVQKKITIMVTSLAQSIAKVMTSDSVVKTLKLAWGTILTTLSDMIDEDYPMVAWAFKKAGQSSLASANWDDSYNDELSKKIANEKLTDFSGAASFQRIFKSLFGGNTSTHTQLTTIWREAKPNTSRDFLRSAEAGSDWEFGTMLRNSHSLT